MPTKIENKTRPSTVQATLSVKQAQPLDYRLIKSPNLRRRAYSAGITPKINQQPSPTMEKTKQTAALPVKVFTAPAETTKRDKEALGKKDITESLKAVKKVPQVISRQASASASVQRRK